MYTNITNILAYSWLTVVLVKLFLYDKAFKR